MLIPWFKICMSPSTVLMIGLVKFELNQKKLLSTTGVGSGQHQGILTEREGSLELTSSFR
jgi:hypothetical protein